MWVSSRVRQKSALWLPHRGFATGRDDFRRGERLELLAVAISRRRPGIGPGGRMQIDLAHALREVPHDAREPCAAHLP